MFNFSVQVFRLKFSIVLVLVSVFSAPLKIKWKGIIFYLLSFHLLFASLGFAQINITDPFGCQNVYVVYNITSQLYTGVYDLCNKIPALLVINQSNVTVINKTEIIVANYSINLTTFNCDESSLLQNFSNISNSFIGSIEERFNLTGLYSDCRYSKDTLQREVSECADRVDNFTQNYISRVNAQVPVDVCNANLTSTSAKLQDMDKLLNYYALGGAIAASLLIWFFRLRGRSDYKDSSMPIQGEETIHTKAIEADARRAQESYNKEGPKSFRKKITDGAGLFKKKKRRGS